MLFRTRCSRCTAWRGGEDELAVEGWVGGRGGEGVGGRRTKRETVWLVYASSRVVVLLVSKSIPLPVCRLWIRIQEGVKQEPLPLMLRV